MEWKSYPVTSFLSLFILLFTPFITRAQLVVDDTPTPQWLVQNILVGQGVQVSNVTFQGDPLQIGEFDATNANNVNMQEGIILSTGDVNTAVGPNNSGSAGTDMNQPGDPDLQQALGGTQTYDAAVLEFDFVPQGDTISFDYIFGSEEYLEFVGAGYNDVFAFFISGPGINGPYSNNAENIALIPGTTTPVSIDNVNDVNNSAYYVNNGDGFTSPYDTDPAYIQYDGFTTLLEAVDSVYCDSTYHLKMAIADAGDGIYDSGVLLKGGSLTSNTIQVDVTTVTPDSSVIRGCTEATVNLIRPDTSEADTVHFDLGGSAVNGVDYSSIADSVIFQVGDSTQSFTITPILDSSSGAIGNDTLIIEVPTINDCGDTIIKTGIIYIKEIYDIKPSLKDTTIFCPTDSVPFTVLPDSLAIAPYDYSWSTGDSGNTAYLPGDSTDSIFVTMTDSCDATGSDTALLDLQWDSLELAALSDTTYGCVTWNPLDLIANPSNGTSPYSYSWDPGGGSSQTHTVSPSETTEYEVTVSDACGDSLHDTVLVEVPDTNGIEIGVHTPSPDSSVVEGCSFGYFSFLRPDTSQSDTIIFSIGGSAVMGTHYNNISDSLFYAQGDSLDSVLIDPIVDAIPQQPDTVTVTTQRVNLCGDTIVNQASIYILDIYNVQVSASDSTIRCPTDSVPFHAQAQGGNLPYDYNWSTGSTDDTAYASGMYNDTLWVTATDSCGNTSQADTVVLTLDYDTLELDLTEDTSVTCPGDPVDLSASVSGGHTDYSYNWSPTGGSSSSIQVSPNDSSVYYVTVTDSCGFEDLTDSVLVAVPQPDPVEAHAPDTTVQCIGDSIVLKGEATEGYGGYAYDWTGGPNDSLWGFPSFDDSVYVLTVTDQCGNSDQDSSFVTHPDYDPLEVEANGPDTICLGNNAELSALASGGAGGYVYDWSGEAPVDQLGDGEAISAPEEEGTFLVQVTDLCGNNTDQDLDVFVEDCQIEVPNVITPNGDGKNEVFLIKNLEHYPQSELLIYNRWGNLLYEDPDYQNDWEGEDLSDGTYFYVLRPGNGEEEPMKGKLTILRDE